MRPNGNLVVTGLSNNTIWQSSTFGPSIPGATAQITNNGQLIVGTQNQTAFIGRLRTQYPCGTFISYDTVTDRGGPIIEGFFAGNYLDGSKVYVGYAANLDCDGQTIAPARIRAISPAGGYVGRCGIEAYEPNTAFYLQNNPNLRWVSATSQTLMSVNNALGIVGGNFTFLFARVNASSNGLNYVQIGKGDAIVNIPGYEAHKVWWYSVDTDNEEEAVDFEILTCIPEVSTTNIVTEVMTTTPLDTTTTILTTTTIDTTSISSADTCGIFKKYDPINDRSAPEREGVLGGIGYRDKVYQYVGYGNNDFGWACAGQNPCPGYITVNNPNAGVYMSCHTGLKFDNLDGYYLLDHPNLEWVATNSSEMLNVPNAIILNGTNGLLWPFMFGRTIYQGEYTLGKAHIGNNAFLLNFYGDNGEERYFTNFEVLTCNPRPENTSTTLRLPTTTAATLEPTTEALTTLDGQCNNLVSAGECLIPGSERYSCNGFYKTVFEADGNLVTYTTYEPITILWQTNTSNQGAAYVCLKPNGQLVITDPLDNIIWGIEWSDPEDPSSLNPKLVQDDDGSLKIVTDDGPFWSSGVDGSPPGTISPPNPFISPFTTPPNNPKNISEIAGPCGTFLPYDPINGKTDLENFGFPGGVHYVNNSIQYIGYGNNAWCGAMNTAPGFILSGSGCYMPCHRSRNNTFDDVSCKYLTWHPSLR